MTVIIGLRGGKRSGKDTIAKHLVAKYGARAYAIARDLKDIAAKLYELSDAQLNGSREDKEAVDPRWGLSPRAIMERVGDALRSTYGRDFQVNNVVSEIVFDSPDLAVISDVRFLDEAETIQTELFEWEPTVFMWRLHYPPGVRLPGTLHQSESEWMLGDVDVEITPSGESVEELHRQVDEACGLLGIKPLGATKSSLKPVITCAARHWFGTDQVGAYSHCVLDASHVDSEAYRHEDTQGRWWSVSRTDGKHL